MPLLTLTSDIGNHDYLTGAIKARLLNINPDFRLIDISHNIAPFNYPQASYVCRNAIKNFPDFTNHIILVNLFDKNQEHLLLAFHHNQYLFCANNGLLTMILEEKPEMVIGIPWPEGKLKNTLQCVDIFGNIISQLNAGESIKNIGVPDIPYVEKNPLRPAVGDDWIDGQIIFIDNFENVIVNITRHEFEELRKGRGVGGSGSKKQRCLYPVEIELRRILDISLFVFPECPLHTTLSSFGPFIPDADAVFLQITFDQ